MKNDPALIIPVYLNQRMVFDLVAMLQGGISTVTRVSETNQERLSTENSLQATFGLADAFASLLKINLSAGQNQLSGDESAKSSEEERVHTPSSLFFVLRKGVNFTWQRDSRTHTICRCRESRCSVPVPFHRHVVTKVVVHWAVLTRQALNRGGKTGSRECSLPRGAVC